MANKKIKVFVIAGEVSGDVLGAKIMREMKDVDFIGIGGENMKAEGLKPLFPISDLAVMGFIEVLANARTLTGRISQTAQAIIKSKPDIVLSIDSPSFAKRVIKKVRDSQMCGCEDLPKFYHVVAPQVWAWGAKRAKKFPEIFDKLYSFFEFERPYFTKYGLDTVAVGHPIADGLKVSTYKPAAGDKKIITLLPGSRMSEVKKLLPVLHSVINRMTTNETFANTWNGYRFNQTPAPLNVTDKPKYDDKGFEFVIPTTETTDAFIRNEIKTWAIKPRLIPFAERYKTLEKTYIAIAASGTISAELAIMHIPAIVVYKMNALTMWLARRVVKIKWVSLVNILLQKTVYPELLGGDANAENIVREVERLSKTSERKKMISEFESADKMWRRASNKTASQLIASDIKKSI